MRGSSAADPINSESNFISEVFHDLSQPLTALHCTLDLALRQDRSFEQLRASVQSALDNAERLRQRLLLLRALKEAELPDQTAELIDLKTMLHELGDDIRPIFESTGKRLDIYIAEDLTLVRAAPGRLYQALFAFVEYLYRYLPAGEKLTIRLNRNRAGLGEIRIESGSCLPASPDGGRHSSPYSCEIELVRRTFLAADGAFELIGCNPEGSVWSATLPLMSTSS